MYPSHFYYGSSITIQQQKHNKKAAKNSTTVKNGMPGRKRTERFVLSKTARRDICSDSIRQRARAEKHLLFRRALPEQKMRLLQNCALDRKAERRPVVPNAGRPVEEPEFAAQPPGGKTAGCSFSSPCSGAAGRYAACRLLLTSGDRERNIRKVPPARRCGRRHPAHIIRFLVSPPSSRSPSASSALRHGKSRKHRPDSEQDARPMQDSPHLVFPFVCCRSDSSLPGIPVNQSYSNPARFPHHFRSHSSLVMPPSLTMPECIDIDITWPSIML